MASRPEDSYVYKLHLLFEPEYVMHCVGNLTEENFVKQFLNFPLEYVYRKSVENKIVWWRNDLRH
jgi:hypothetical protein